MPKNKKLVGHFFRTDCISGQLMFSMLVDVVAFRGLPYAVPGQGALKPRLLLSSREENHQAYPNDPSAQNTLRSVLPLL